jgi:hypothetical protein
MLRQLHADEISAAAYLDSPAGVVPRLSRAAPKVTAAASVSRLTGASTSRLAVVGHLSVVAVVVIVDV